MPAHENEESGLCRQTWRAVSSTCSYSKRACRKVYELRPGRAQRRADASPKAEIDDERPVAVLGQRRADVFEAERLHAEERTEAETLVPWIGAHQEDVHGPS
jgi:hypothetical protein